MCIRDSIYAHAMFYLTRRGSTATDILTPQYESIKIGHGEGKDVSRHTREQFEWFAKKLIEKRPGLASYELREAKRVNTDRDDYRLLNVGIHIILWALLLVTMNLSDLSRQGNHTRRALKEHFRRGMPTNLTQIYNYLSENFVFGVEGGAPSPYFRHLHPVSNVTVVQFRSKAAPCPADSTRDCLMPYTDDTRDTSKIWDGSFSWMYYQDNRNYSFLRQDVGVYGDYGFDGHLLEWQRFSTASDLKATMSLLSSYNFLDNRTRAIRVFALLYEPRTRIFYSCETLTEVSTNLRLITRPTIKIFRVSTADDDTAVAVTRIDLTILVIKGLIVIPVSYTHLTLPTIYSV
eukprot:TRINITY_DN14960_c0_g1_i1.p1 TRINITY_DN14960_c0_g1~~TRINITY_DN14960_c0_g1_i1.p1  ORF type:complete len:366 (-),score=30.45 TRINITY_DN14960_c0_g1_i1:34-1074(-)